MEQGVTRGWQSETHPMIVNDSTRRKIRQPKRSNIHLIANLKRVRFAWGSCQWSESNDKKNHWNLRTRKYQFLQGIRIPTKFCRFSFYTNQLLQSDFVLAPKCVFVCSARVWEEAWDVVSIVGLQMKAFMEEGLRHLQSTPAAAEVNYLTQALG